MICSFKHVKIIATLLATAMVLAACSGTPEAPEVETVDETATEVVAEPTEAPAPTDPPEPTAEPAPTDPPEPTDEPEPTAEPEPTDEPEPEPEMVEQVEKVVIAYNGYEGNMTPFTHTFNSLPNTHNLIMMVYDTLFWSANDDEPDPWLAETAVPNEDFTTWQVTLRPGITWHDGEPLTAEDVAFTFEYFEASGLPGRYAHHTFDQPHFVGAEVIDELTIDISFEAPLSTFTYLPGGDLPIIPKHIWESIEKPAAATEMLPIGSGPYKLVEIVPDELYRFEANNDYFLGAPAVAAIDMPIITAPPAAWAALEAGQVDFVARDVAPPLVAKFSGDDNFTVARGTHMTSINMFFNTRRPLLGDAAVRKAIAMAMDKQALVDTILLGNGRVGNDNFVHPDSPWALPDGAHQFDPEAAAALLDDAGYTEFNDAGIRLSPEGQPLSFEVLAPSTAPLIQRAIQLVAEQMLPLGIELRIEALDVPTIRQRRLPALEFDYDIFLQPLESHTHADPDGLYYFFHSPGKGVGGIFSAYRNPAFDALAEEAAVTIDLDERAEMLYDMQRMLAEDVPAIVLYYPDGIYAYRTETYNGWVVEPGHGAFTKRSFLPQTVDQ